MKPFVKGQPLEVTSVSGRDVVRVSTSPTENGELRPGRELETCTGKVGEGMHCQQIQPCAELV